MWLWLFSLRASILFQVSSALPVMLVLKNWICPNWYIREQFDHNTNFVFAYAKFCSWKTLSKSRKLSSLNWVTRSTKKCMPHTSTGYLSVSHSHSRVVLELPIKFQINLLLTLSVARRRRITFKRCYILNYIRSVVFELKYMEVQPFSCDLILRLFHRRLNRLKYLSLESNLFRNTIHAKI